MTRNEFLLGLLIGLPLLGSVLVYVLGQICEKLRNWVSLMLVLAAFGCGVVLLAAVNTNQTVSIGMAGFNWFYADRLAIFMSLVSLLVSSAIVTYSFGYISHYQHRNEYYFMITLFLGSMMGLVFSTNLILLYLFWEITSLTSWRLIGFFRDKPCVIRADKAFLVTGFGALVMLLGFIMIYQQTGSFDLHAIKQFALTRPIANLAVALILVGILSKSATFPLQTWLPDAGVAPSPVTAMLHAAVLVKIGVYVFARLFIVTFSIDPVWNTIVPLLAGVSAIVSAGAAFIETDLKRIIAYSTISQIGFIFLGLSVGTEIGIGGGILFILMHGIAKGGLFLCAGIIEQNTHQKDITKLGGLISSMPLTAVSFIFCAFSVMGIPPFGGFLSKYMVMSGAVAAKQPLVVAIFLVAAFMTIIYLFRVFTLVFLGSPRTQIEPRPAEGSPVMVGSVLFLGALALLSGLLVQYPTDFIFTLLRGLGK